MKQHRYFGLLLGMGLGKTATCLTASLDLMYDQFEVEKILVIAPKRVAEHTWPEEVKQWEHTCKLKVSVAIGSEKERIQALKAKADIYSINRDNVDWLTAYYGQDWPFDMVILDESSSFKNPASGRFKALKRVRPFIKRLYILTGTPAPNGLIDLWSQIYLLDKGERLEPTITQFRAKYFKPGKSNGHVVYDYVLQNKEHGEQMIYGKISDICISMKAEDYLELPERVDQTVEIELPKHVLAEYKEFEKEQVLALLDGPEITALNAAALTNKLLQFSNGAMYDNEQNKEWHSIHDYKIEALAEDIEAANGAPFLVFYQYKHDVARLMEAFKKLKPVNLSEHKGEKGNKVITDWNAGKIKLLFAHAASAGHGLNMQRGGNLMGWFGVPWSLELYQQAVARLDRQGQTKSVINRRYIVKGTMDAKVLPRLDDKTATQENLLAAVKAMVAEYKK